MPENKKTLYRQLNIKAVPRNLMLSFGAYCRLRGISMKAKIIEMMRECVSSGVLPTEGKEKDK